MEARCDEPRLRGGIFYPHIIINLMRKLLLSILALLPLFVVGAFAQGSTFVVDKPGTLASQLVGHEGDTSVAIKGT